jgi:hypothetical protein
MSAVAPPRQTLGAWDAGEDDYVIAPREWLLGSAFCRRFLSSLLADGGVGKTAVRVAQLISLAIGRSLTGEHVFQRCRVLIVSLEDDKDELRRRVNAVMRFHGIDADELKGWLYLAAPKGLRLAEMNDGTPQAGALESLLREEAAAHNLDVISLDPFVKTHSLPENENGAIDFVCTLLTKLAIEYNCAVDTPHHTKKGKDQAGDADAGRGASAMKNAARLVYTLTQMSDAEAKRFGVDEADRRFMIRIDSGKVNIAPASRAERWFRLVGVPLHNGNALYPNGDEVQTVEPWLAPRTWDSLDTATVHRILDDIGTGLPNGSRYSDANNAGEIRAAWRVVMRHAPDKTEQQAREVIRTWVKKGVLKVEDYDDPEQDKPRKGLWVNAVNRPH